MRNEKKYELTLSDLQVYIGIASFEALPKDAIYRMKQEKAQ